MVTVNLIGKCTNIQLTPANGEPNHCMLTVQLDRNLAEMLYRPLDVQLVIPVEFAACSKSAIPLASPSAKTAIETWSAHASSSDAIGAESAPAAPGPPHPDVALNEH